MASSSITIQPALRSDFETLARIEEAAFADHEFGPVAFGPPSEAGLHQRAASLDESKVPGEAVKIDKATMTGPDGKEEIVGWASWCRFTASDAAAVGKLEVEDKEKLFAGMACPRLCVDTLLRWGELMKESCGGDDYLKLAVIVTSPQVQRRGVGTKLLEVGLREADAAGLQTVLAATPAGEPLYKRYGFLEYEVSSVSLSDYEGGEGKGIASVVIMNRPARSPATAEV